MRKKKETTTLEMIKIIERKYGKDTGIGDDQEFLKYLEAGNLPALYEMIKPIFKNATKK